MNFTDSPFERMMKEVPHYPAPNRPAPAPEGSLCHKCGYWRGMTCTACYRKLKRKSSESKP